MSHYPVVLNHLQHQTRGRAEMATLMNIEWIQSIYRKAIIFRKYALKHTFYQYLLLLFSICLQVFVINVIRREKTYVWMHPVLNGKL